VSPSSKRAKKTSPKRDEKRSAKQGSLVLTNIGQLGLAMCGSPARGEDLRALEFIENATLLISNGKITGFIETGEMYDMPGFEEAAEHAGQVIDCGGRLVLPGFLDGHTHPIFSSPRLIDFEKRIVGATYEEISAAGGGIRSSVDGVRKASEEELAANALQAFNEMLAHGTTAVEAKSGYGLSTDAELKSLEAISLAAKRWKGNVVPTLLGAHVVPKEHQKSRGKYVDEICQKMIPTAARRKLAQYVDVFVEQSAFTLDEAIRIFEAATTNDLEVRAHVCQLSPGKIKPLLRFEPASLDHMDHCDAAEVAALAKTDTIATLVPGANYFLGLKQYPDARKLIDQGVAVALATDYNPGTSPTLNMQMVLSLACTQMKMTPKEAIIAATVNGAYSLGYGHSKGRIEPMADADIAIFDCEDYRELPYWFGSNHCWMTIVGGEVAWRKEIIGPESGGRGISSNR
jgi:imidazolonepropionase